VSRRRDGTALLVVLLALALVASLIGPVLTLATGARQRTDQERTRFLLAGRIRLLLVDVLARPFDDLAPWAGSPTGWLEEPPPEGLQALRSRVAIGQVGPGLLEIEATLEWVGRDGMPRRTVVRRLRSRDVITLEHRREEDA
jgi:hypothetical protein